VIDRPTLSESITFVSKATLIAARHTNEDRARRHCFAASKTVVLSASRTPGARLIIKI
jgi:hypothetical protein